MSFLIKGGYDVFNRSVNNIFFRRTAIWKHVIIKTQNNLFLGKIDTEYDNILDMIKIENKHLLTLNNRIIYENTRPIIYNVNLFTCPKEYKHGITDIRNCIQVFNVPYNKIKQ